MKLLITTQIVDQDDPNLGFFHQWIEEFARHVEHVEVICLKEGSHTFPENVRVHSLGKEKALRPSWVYALRFLRLSWRLRREYDAVFVHMNPEYLVVAGWLWRLIHKPTTLWYVHKKVNLVLRIAEFFATSVCTASRESFRLPSKKVRVLGHGIVFVESIARSRDSEGLKILSVSRISATKRIDTMVQLAQELESRNTRFSLTIVGAPATPEDVVYEKELHRIVGEKLHTGSVVFHGPVRHQEVLSMLVRAQVFLNLSATGSMDKAVLEALGAGVSVVSSNEAFQSLLTPYGLYVSSNNPSSLADAVIRAPQVDMEPLTKAVRSQHSLSSLVPAILQSLPYEVSATGR